MFLAITTVISLEPACFARSRKLQALLLTTAFTVGTALAFTSSGAPTVRAITAWSALALVAISGGGGVAFGGALTGGPTVARVTVAGGTTGATGHATNTPTIASTRRLNRALAAGDGVLTATTTVAVEGAHHHATATSARVASAAKAVLCQIGTASGRASVAYSRESIMVVYRPISAGHLPVLLLLPPLPPQLWLHSLAAVD